MAINLMRWDTDGITMWGSSTDWVVRAADETEARAIALREPEGAARADERKWPLVVTEVPVDGPAECILWYGPDL